MNISEIISLFSHIPCSQFFTTELQYSIKLVGLLSYAVIVSFSTISLNCEKPLLASSCLSVHMEKLGYHWMDFREISYLVIV